MTIQRWSDQCICLPPFSRYYISCGMYSFVDVHHPF
jgi:hypothetical protein